MSDNYWDKFRNFFKTEVGRGKREDGSKYFYVLRASVSGLRAVK